MLMALCFEPTFFLKGKVRHKHAVRGEVSQVWNEHKRRYKKKQGPVITTQIGLWKSDGACTQNA